MKKRNNWFQNKKELRKEARLAKKHSLPEHQYTLETRLPRVGDYTPRFDLPDSVLLLYHNIEEIAEDVLSKLDVNELNEKYLDQYIITVCEMGIVNSLEDQRTLHKRLCLSIREELECQRNILMKELEDYKKTYEENRKELENI